MSDGAVNEARQRELGLARFVWRSQGDDRVRDEHERRDGRASEQVRAGYREYFDVYARQPCLAHEELAALLNRPKEV